ncbi:MAG: hypothetical protein Q4F00_08245, partial [bacterium]|nr:hypothetical protein [bacterium]
RPAAPSPAPASQPAAAPRSAAPSPAPASQPALLKPEYPRPAAPAFAPLKPETAKPAAPKPDVSQLLETAITQMDHSAYTDVIATIDKATAIGEVGSVFLELQAVCEDMAKVEDALIDGAVFRDVMGHVKVSHEMIVAWKEENGDLEMARHAYDRIVNSAATQALQISQKLPHYLADPQHWQEAVTGAFVILNAINDFLVWGMLSAFFEKAYYGISPRGHEPHTWAVSGLNIMHAVSQCYQEGNNLSREEAQTCYVLAQKFKQMEWLNKEAALAPRVIPPYVKGGEGVHSHRIERAEKINGKSSSSDYSVCDQEYFRSAVMSSRRVGFVKRWLVKSPTNIVCGILCLLLILFDIYVLHEPEFVKNNMALVGFVNLAVIFGVPLGMYLSARKTLLMKIRLLYLQWVASPGHGTDDKELSVNDFKNMLGEEFASIIDWSKLDSVDDSENAKQLS